MFFDRSSLLLSACCLAWVGCMPAEEEAVAHPQRGDHGSNGGHDTDLPGDTGEPDDTDEEPVEEGDAAVMLFDDLPGELSCGETAEAIVSVGNTGTNTWTREEGYKLGAVDDEDPLYDSGDVRVWLEEDQVVEPGDVIDFVVPLRAPDDLDGTVLTDWQMVHEGVHWFGEQTSATVEVECATESTDESEPLELPDMSWLVEEVAEERPDLLADSCLDDGGSWDFLDLLVDRLREYDTRWGYNWKRGVEGDPSEDVVDYHYGSGEPEGSEEVYILDVIVGHCGDDPQPGYLDQTQATADAGTIGRWTGRGRF